MPFSMYQLSIPVFLRGLEIVDEYCDRAAEFSSAHGIEPHTLLSARLAPGTLPFSGQVQAISDGSKGPVGRLASVSPPNFDDSQQSFADLKARIEKTVAFLRSVPPEQLLGSETRTVVAKSAWGVKALPGAEYLMSIALPDFYFHVGIAHDTLQVSGVPLGRRDFLFLPKDIREAIG